MFWETFYLNTVTLSNSRLTENRENSSPTCKYNNLRRQDNFSEAITQVRVPSTFNFVFLTVNLSNILNIINKTTHHLSEEIGS